LTDRSVDCVIMALLLHRLPDPARAIVEVHRVLRPGGSLLIKTIAPADAAGSLPYRLFPTIAAAQRARMPGIPMIKSWASAAGFVDLSIERLVRDRPIDPEQLASAVISDATTRYPELGDDEQRRGLRLLREEAARRSGDWAEERTTTLVRATRA
jgi:SAM-dependent methyltransferase